MTGLLWRVGQATRLTKLGGEAAKIKAEFL